MQSEPESASTRLIETNRRSRLGISPYSTEKGRVVVIGLAREREVGRKSDHPIDLIPL